MSNDPETKTPSQSSKRRLPWRGIGVLLSALGVIVLLFAFYVGLTRLLQINMELAQAVTQLRFGSDQNQNELAALKNNVTTMQQESLRLRDEIKTQTQAMDEVRRSLLDSKNGWLIDEARYLVNLANDHLQFENNIPLTITMLQSADRALQNVNDPGISSIRQALASDIVNLQGISPVDVRGIYLRLLALNVQASQLPLISKPVAIIPNANNSTSHLPWWKRGWQQTVEALQKIVVVRYHPQNAPALMTPDAQDFLYLNLHATFEKAMWAVLNRQQDVYQASLQQAITLIKQYFVQDSAITQAMLTHLAGLQQINIHPEAPKIMASVQAFENYVKRS